MCSSDKTQVIHAEIKAFKAFELSKDGKLRSCFVSKQRYNQVYEVNQAIRVSPETETFFAFADIDYAFHFINNLRVWNVTSKNLIVLPVTLYDVVDDKQLHMPSGDDQTLDAYAPTWQAKGIFVHYSQRIVTDFYNKVLAMYISQKKYSMPPIIHSAFNHFNDQGSIVGVTLGDVFANMIKEVV